MGDGTDDGRAAAQRADMASISDAERLAEAGVLLEGVVHRINNPLASLLLGLSQLAEQLGRDRGEPLDVAAAQRLAQEARAEGERVAQAVRELRGLFPSDAPRRVDAYSLLQDVLASLELQRWGKVRIERRLGMLLPVFVREARFAQVLRSAGQLVIDALGQVGDEVALLVEAEEHDNALLVRLGRLAPASPAFPELLGQGFPRLTLLRGMVQQLGGTLVLQPDAVELSLPVEAPVYDSESEVDLTQRESAPPRGEMRILLVDDDPSIHRALARGLSVLGAVQSVRSMPSAVELIEGGARFDVILADLIMPDGTGLDLFDWLGQHAPKLKRRMILMTGMGETHTDSHPDVVVVGKPFDLPALRELVCSVATRG